MGDQGVQPVPVQGEAGANPAQLVGAVGLGVQHQADGGARRLDDAPGLGERLGGPGAGLEKPVAGHRHPGDGGEQRAQGAGGLALFGEQPGQVAVELFGQGEGGDQFGGLRGGHHQDVGVGGAQRPQQGELPGAGQRRELLGVQRGGADQVERRAEAWAELAECGAEGLLLVHPGRREVLGVPDGLLAEPDPEHGVDGAVRVVGGEQQGPAALAGGVQRGGGGDQRRAVTADQDRPEGHCPSTRFFNPASARSMMTFSALRLIMPSIGIFTSTASWYVTSVPPATAARL